MNRSDHRYAKMLPKMFKYKLSLQYDGTNYYGWQYQKPNKYGIYPTVQSELHQAIFHLTKEEVISAGAGRTDAGVHAIKQICHIVLHKYIVPAKLMEGLNYFLKDTAIVVYDAEFVDENFHARFQAKEKTYHYLIWNSLSRNIFYEKKAWHISKKIDLNRLKMELQTFVAVGAMNFQSFRDAECQAEHAMRIIKDVDMQVKDYIHNYQVNSSNNYSQLIQLTFTARSFLHHQVRIMVGTLVQLCIYNRKTNIQSILQQQNRAKAGVTAPAYGLYLADVQY